MTLATWLDTWRRRTAAWLLELVEDRSYRAGAAAALRSRARGETKQLRASAAWESAQVNMSDWPTPTTGVLLPRWITGYEAGLRAPCKFEPDNDDTDREAEPEIIDLNPEPTDDFSERHDTITDMTVPAVSRRPQTPMRLRHRFTALSALGLHKTKRAS